MEKTAIKIDHLTKVYKIFDKPTDRVKEALHPFGKRFSKDFYALNDVSFEIKRGETVGIIGKNGAGKSTLLKIITGVLTPTSGTVQVIGRIASLLELGAGFNPEMTGIENIYLNGSLMGYSKEEMDDRLQDIVDFADIGDFIHQPVKMYSSGMFARLAFAVNVSVEPDILIVDEALSVGDEFFQQKCLYKMKQLQRNGVTVLFVSHAVAAVKALCDRCILMENGKKAHDGQASVVCDIYQNKTTDIRNKGIIADSSNGTIDILQKDDFNSLFHDDEDFKKRVLERSGSKEVEFVGCDFYARGEIISALELFSRIHVVVSMLVNADIPSNAAMGFLCRNELGIDVFAGNLNYYGVYFPNLKKGQKVVVDITYNAPLAPGIYYFGLGLKPNSKSSYFYDRVFNAARLEIKQSEKKLDALGGIIAAELLSVSIYS